MEDELLHQDLQSKIVAVTAEMNEWCGLVTEAAELLKVPHADVALQCALLKSVRDEMDAQVTDKKALWKQL